MTQRSDDDGGIRIERTIPLWGLITVAGLLMVNVISFWAGQLSTATKVEDLIVMVRAMDAQSRAREGKDGARDALIAEHERRITRLETRTEARP